jgi:fructose-bisphosphate aldolase, class I
MSKPHDQALTDIAHAMLVESKGLLAMDESTGTCNRRFASLNIPQTAEARRDWRELLVTTSGLEECISGAILFDETFRQKLCDGRSFVKALEDANIIPGIKVDIGATDLAGHAGEKVTEGLDGLRGRLREYADMGARFAKWRAVIVIGEGLPGRVGIDVNAHALARYAALCQEVGLVPIIEPEVLMDGTHDLGRCLEVSEEVQRSVFRQLHFQGVRLEGAILKPNMVLPGIGCAIQNTPEEIADATVQSLLRTVPPGLPGIAFLSGGQTPELATARLNAMHVRFKSQLPWALTFSFSRALQQSALALWHGEAAKRIHAQESLLHRARCNQAALRGQYSARMEQE